MSSYLIAFDTPAEINFKVSPGRKGLSSANRSELQKSFSEFNLYIKNRVDALTRELEENGLIKEVELFEARNMYAFITCSDAVKEWLESKDGIHLEPSTIVRTLPRKPSL